MRTSQNNGLRGYINEDKKYLNEGNTIAFGQDTATVFYQEKPYFTGDKIKVLKAVSQRFNKKNAQFFLTALSKGFSSFSWGNSSFNIKVLGNTTIKLPIKDNQPDFDFMEEFIEQLEQGYIQRLDDYLAVTGLKDFTLSDAERQVLIDFESWDWAEFRIEDILTWQVGVSELNPLHLDKLTISKESKYPFYGQSTTNNGVIKYIHLKDEVLNNKKGKPTILIHSNNQNTVYLETPFYLKDGHGATSVLQSEKLNEMTAHFLIASIKKVIVQMYSYQNKATKIALKNTLMQLPITNNKPDYSKMELLISAAQKLVIRDVVHYANEHL